MKTNFKKLALLAGVSAAMAAGSMPANAVIQAVPAPAALVPLFSTHGQTNVRIEVPSSVGLDTVVNLFGGPNTVGNGIPSSGVAPGLSSSSTSKLHWFFMDKNSNEIANSVFPVSANDVIEFSSTSMPTAVVGKEAITVDLPADINGYLVIINESAYLGDAPLFSFQADAFWNPGENYPVNNIPVFPLTDDADHNDGAPSLWNNVLENVANVPSGASYGGGPIVSPLVSGIRLGVADNGGVAYNWYRTVDFPVNGNHAGETYAVWNDRNASTNIVNGAIVVTPGVTGTMLSYDCNENQISIPSLSLDTQLSFVSIGANAYGEGDLRHWRSNAPINPRSDSYAGLPLANTHTGTGCYEAGGFIRWFAQPNPYNYGNEVNAAYQSMVVIRLRQDAYDGYSQFPVDRGFFTAK